MKKIYLFLILLCPVFCNSQTYLEKKWDHTFGGISIETLTGIKQTSDGGYILIGFTNSDSSGEISEHARGGYDFWVVKTDSSGTLVWEKMFGGDQNEELFSVDETYDGGFILGGFTGSDSSYDVTSHSKGNLDYWLVKINSAGQKLWDKRYGGTDPEWMTSLQETADSGIIMGGYSFSDSTGDVSQHSRGGSDFWIVKTDANGTKLWDKKYGGNSTDEMYAIQQTSDNGYILGGISASDSIDEVTYPNRGSYDYWVVRVDQNGSKLWDRRFGGNNRDKLLALDVNYDGSIVLGGFSYSDLSGDITQPSRDTSTSVTTNRGDALIVKLDSLGAVKWNKRYGGDITEDAFGYVTQSKDSGYIFACASYSEASGDKTEDNLGMEQSWLVKLDTAGDKVWDKTIFASGEDEYAYPIEVDSACYVIANWSQSDSIAYKSEKCRGNYDYWMIKFCETSTPQLPEANFSVSNTEICQGGCFSFQNLSYNAGSFKWYFPGSSTDSSTVASPTNICYPDSGYFHVILIAINSAGTDTLVDSNAVYIRPLPLVNLSSIGDSMFVDQNYSSYIWYLDSIAIPNDTSYWHIATVDGDYMVTVTDSFGCPATDSIYNFHVGVKEFTMNGIQISIYPNPAKNEITIEGLDDLIDGTIRIMDPLSKIYYSNKIINARHQIQISNLTSGIYFIEVNKHNQKSFARFIKE